MRHDRQAHRLHGGCGRVRQRPPARRRRPRRGSEDELTRLEAYQRDLEQRVADVAARIKELREEKAAEEEGEATATTETEDAATTSTENATEDAGTTG